MTRCELSDLPADQCAHCTGDVLPVVRGRVTAPERLRQAVGGIGARMEGVCPECRKSVFEGDVIEKRWDGRWCHLACATGAE